MDLAFRRQLYNLAEARAVAMIARRSELQLQGILLTETELYSLACRKQGAAHLSDFEVLQTFFNDEAYVLLLRMPNRYWFWRVVQLACVADDGADDKLLTRQCLQSAILAIRREYSSKYDLRKRIEDLEDDDLRRRDFQIASRAVAGICLVQTRGGEFDVIVDNPLFFESSLVSD